MCADAQGVQMQANSFVNRVCKEQGRNLIMACVSATDVVEWMEFSGTKRPFRLVIEPTTVT